LLHLSSTAPSIILDKTETGWGSLRFYKAGSQVSYIQLDGSEEMIYYQPSGLGHLFYAGGVAALKIQNDGKVGIGTNAPSHELHIASSDNRPTIRLQGNKTSDGNFADIYATNDGTNGEAQISFRRAGANDAVDMLFYTSATSSAMGERMRVTSIGNVGIGTSSPSAKLHIQSDGSHDEGAEIVLRHSNNNTTDVVSTLSFQNNGGQVAMIQSGTTGANNTGYISFFTDNAGASSEKMRILGNGNIGIGRSTAHGKLDILAADLGSSSGDVSVVGRSSSDVGSNTMYLLEEYVRTSAGSDWTTSGVRLQAKTDSTYQGYIQFNGDGNNYGVSFGTGGGGTSSPGTTAERMRIQSDGNVGIGTTSPTTPLHVVGNTVINGVTASLDFSQLSTILMAMLGMAGLRTYEKKEKVTKGN
jgi:hypothetical protein